MKVAYLGPDGSFTHAVASRSFSYDELVPSANITEVIKFYENGSVDYAIVPVENSIEGSVHETLDYLFHHDDIEAVAEIIQPIKQQLLAIDTHRPIEKILSHPQAIAQGKQYIETHYPHATIETTASTAYAARYVAEHPELALAAIAPLQAANTYHLQVIAKNIQEIDENYTRFWVLGKNAPHLSLTKESSKITLALTLPDNIPGALYKALSVFAWRNIDLTKIESRPLKTVLGEYFFIIDLLVLEEKVITYALEELKTLGITSKILGNYQVYRI
ncbi:prephenate dehydratase [Streptococcus sciuri]|uniref:Prephenate dehydratase n=1 Tax=Streptococcus sciuri TaxID=2973939 RepID=A0ABT2F4U3_9STRE|nr:prephenate dehydratase [Streptococcus sciuri]MCS4487489.1 prephenate dehydratase [Streptococcus sciuri]